MLPWTWDWWKQKEGGTLTARERKPLKNDGWETNLSFWGLVTFQGRFLLNFRWVCSCYQSSLTMMKDNHGHIIWPKRLFAKMADNQSYHETLPGDSIRDLKRSPNVGGHVHNLWIRVMDHHPKKVTLTAELPGRCWPWKSTQTQVVHLLCRGYTVLGGAFSGHVFGSARLWHVC